MDALREACAEVAARARFVRVNPAAIPAYAKTLARPQVPSRADAVVEVRTAVERERAAAFWLTLDAINFGSGWFPTLRKRDGRSGYHTIAAGLSERFERYGAWSADELAALSVEEIAAVLGQDPTHELMRLFAHS